VEQHTALARVLAPHFPLHNARLAFVARFVLALLKVSTVNLARIATALNGTVARASNERRCARFLSGFELPQELIARCVLAVLPTDKLVLSLDRTEHYFGAIYVNVLTLGVAYQGIAFLLFWTCLGKTGNSNTAERIALMERALKLVSPSQVLALTADREFVGIEWFAETLFGAFKTRGFNFEDTHLTKTERIERLFGLMAVALVWAHRVGELIAKRTPIPVKKHGRKQFSVFRYGLDQLRQLLQSGECKKLDWHGALRVLSGT